MINIGTCISISKSKSSLMIFDDHDVCITSFECQISGINFHPSLAAVRAVTDRTVAENMPITKFNYVVGELNCFLVCYPRV